MWLPWATNFQVRKQKGAEAQGNQTLCAHLPVNTTGFPAQAAIRPDSPLHMAAIVAKITKSRGHN